MDIFLKNTLTKQKEKFEPITEKKVGIYTCGPTVYGSPHIGNMRSYVFSDTLRRVFEYNGYEVKQIINITDVGHLVDDGDLGEDKVEKKAKEENKSAIELTRMYTDIFFSELRKLNIETNETVFPKASENIIEQIDMIKNLEEKGLTYKISDGIYFDTSKIEKYGKLGQIDIDGLMEGARVLKNEEKNNPTDFALWKFSKEEDGRQQEWDSPWGIGFPGWHLECSAMSLKYLGEHFDIHTGGIDHIPTHHNNEIAQSEGVIESKHVNYWLHHNHILINGEKMSKSLGNILTLDEISVSPLAYRYWLLTADYKTLINFTDEGVSAASNAYDKLVNILKDLPDGGNINKEYKNKFTEFVNDDLNTAKGIALIWELLKDESISPDDKKETIFDFDKVLGLNLKKESGFKEELPQEILDLVNEREKAKSEKDFKKADLLREEILKKEFVVVDTPEGTKVFKAYSSKK